MTVPIATEVVALRTELETLRVSVASLETQLLGAQHALDMTMRNQLRCRACSCRRIAHAFNILDRGNSDARKELALYQPSWWSSKTQGVLEAYVCTKCGLAEWWVKDPGSLEPHADYLEIIDGDTADAGTPYR
jgi:hypothetical protein